MEAWKLRSSSHWKAAQLQGAVAQSTGSDSGRCGAVRVKNTADGFEMGCMETDNTTKLHPGATRATS